MENAPVRRALLKISGGCSHESQGGADKRKDADGKERFNDARRRNGRWREVLAKICGRWNVEGEGEGSDVT